MLTISRARFSPNSGQILAVSVLILWLGLFVRLHNLAGDSFWFDEILTVETARAGPDGFLNIQDHPPFTYALTSLAIRVFGETEFAARLPALAAGLLALPLTIALGKELRQPLAGLWAALLLALSQVHIAYAQEARHYALLLAISLASYIVLIRAMKRLGWFLWIAYALLTALNLYNHYGAFLVLISQVVLILGWLLSYSQRQGKSGAWQVWRYPITSGLLLVLLYLPWMQRLQSVADYNLGADAVTPTGGLASLGEWAVLLFHAFGMYRGWLPYAMLSFALIGCLVLAWRRQYLSLSVVASATVLPLLLIQFLQVSRGVYARYVLYMLPFYLLAAGLGIVALMEQFIGKRYGLRGHVSASAILIALILLVALPGITAGYQQVQEDWRGVLNHLEQTAEPGDVLVAASMNYRNQFNLVAASLPYYLDRVDQDYLWLPSGQFGLDQATDLAGRQGAATVVAFDWNEPAALLDSALEVERFQTALFSGRELSQAGDSLDKTISLYNELLTVVAEPRQACAFREDLAILLAADGQPDLAMAMLDEIRESCPDLAVRSRFVMADIAALNEQLNRTLADGRYTEAEDAAVRLLQYRPDHAKALDVLSEFNLLQLFNTDQAVVNDDNSPEPVQVTSFTMPREGDARDVMLIHPPAGVTYRLLLPDKDLSLYSRLALAPESWTWGGDGATFVVTMESIDGRRQELLRLHINNDRQDHVWHVVELPLNDYAGQEVSLTLTTEAGPAGDATGDWAGWETPRILRRAPQS